MEPALGAVDQHAIIGVAFAEFEFAPDDIFARAIVAANIDPLDIDTRPFIEHEANSHGLIGHITFAARPRLREGVTLFRDLARQRVDRFLHRVAVIDVARRQTDLRSQRLRVDIGKM